MHFFPADESTGCDEFIFGGQAWVGGLVIPEPQQGQRGGIEHALRHEMQPVTEREQAFHLGVDGDGREAGGGVDAGEQTVGAEPRILRFKRRDPADRSGLERLRLSRGGGRVLDRATCAQRGPSQHAQRHIGRRLGGGRRRGAVTGKDERHGRNSDL